jgi:hypothetical protein
MRDVILRDKSFLLSLFKNNIYQNKKQISGGANIHLNTLLKILHLIVNNEIPIEVSDANAIKKAKKLGLLKKKIKSQNDFTNLLESPAPTKVEFLLRFAGVYRHLLRSLFED